MSNSKPSSTKPGTDARFWPAAAVIMLASATGLAALWPTTVAYAHRQSAQLTNEGKQASGGEAEADFRLATWLNHSNETAFAGLAQAQVAAGHPTDALATLAKGGEGSEVTRTKVRILIELGRYNDAATAAQPLIATGASEADLELAGLAYGLTGRGSDITALLPRVSSPEAIRTLTRAGAGNLPLANELFATGLLRSSSALLQEQPVSFERQLLLARISLASPTASNLTQASSSLSVALNLNPSSLEAHKLMLQVCQARSDPAGIQRETAAIAQLEAGQP